MVLPVDVHSAISSYRAVRKFSKRPLEPEHLERILEAGRRAPSSMNYQRWAFIACTDRDHLRELARIGDYADHIAGAAAAVALVTPEVAQEWERESIAFDLGQATESMLLAAWELGIGGVHAAVYEEALARELLGYPEGYRCDYVLSFGYPADPRALTVPPGETGRRPVEDVVHRERW